MAMPPIAQSATRATPTTPESLLEIFRLVRADMIAPVTRCRYWRDSRTGEARSFQELRALHPLIHRAVLGRRFDQFLRICAGRTLGDHTENLLDLHSGNRRDRACALDGRGI